MSDPSVIYPSFNNVFIGICVDFCPINSLSELKEDLSFPDFFFRLSCIYDDQGNLDKRCLLIYFFTGFGVVITLLLIFIERLLIWLQFQWNLRSLMVFQRQRQTLIANKEGYGIYREDMSQYYVLVDFIDFSINDVMMNFIEIRTNTMRNKSFFSQIRKRMDYISGLEEQLSSDNLSMLAGIYYKNDSQYLRFTDVMYYLEILICKEGETASNDVVPLFPSFLISYGDEDEDENVYKELVVKTLKKELKFVDLSNVSRVSVFVNFYSKIKYKLLKVLIFYYRNK